MILTITILTFKNIPLQASQIQEQNFGKVHTKEHKNQWPSDLSHSELFLWNSEGWGLQTPVVNICVKEE